MGDYEENWLLVWLMTFFDEQRVFDEDDKRRR